MYLYITYKFNNDTTAFCLYWKNMKLKKIFKDNSFIICIYYLLFPQYHILYLLYLYTNNIIKRDLFRLLYTTFIYIVLSKFYSIWITLLLQKMSKKIPLSQNEIQPSFKGFLEHINNKRIVQSRYDKFFLKIIYNIYNLTLNFYFYIICILNVLIIFRI